VHFVVHPGDVVPIYRQLMRQIEDAIATGRLLPGAQLPSHRELSAQLVIAPLTVKKAYDELEALGYLATARGRGTFVRETDARRSPQAAARQGQADALADSARAFVAQAEAAGLSVDEIVELVQDIASASPRAAGRITRRMLK
jgi:GntR family transcriptional regulator